MPWFAWALVAYIVLDRIATVGRVGASVQITPSLAVTTLVTGALLVWAVLATAGVA